MVALYKKRTRLKQCTATVRRGHHPPATVCHQIFPEMWLLLCFLVLPLCHGVFGSYEDVAYWKAYGETRLLETLNQENLKGHAKNVIVFIGDGMGMTTITAARIYKGQQMGMSGEEAQLSYEKFPSVGLSKTYNVNRQVPDSAGTATAIFTGIKSNFYMLGLDSNARFNACDTHDYSRRLESIMTWAQGAGKWTGFVTTTRVSHATPAALYAHSNNRDWECDSEIPADQQSCAKDIARQLVEDEPGRNFRVILGGGLRQFGIPTDMVDEDDSCVRHDGRNLVQAWQQNNPNHLFVNNTGDLLSADVNKAEYLLGLFSPGHMPYALERDTSSKGSPSLLNMTKKAMQMLSRSSKGYVLMVEGGRIDHGHHKNYAHLALHEATELDEAVAYAVSITDPRDTLIIVTADHSHAFTINGYPVRGNDILGYGRKDESEPLYDTLSYANGPGYNLHHNTDPSCGTSPWRTFPDQDRQNIRYQQFSPIYLEDETHGGEDVAVYSRGPSSYLLSGTFEQNYIAHVVGYAACIGPPSKYCTQGPVIQRRTSDPNEEHNDSSIVVSNMLCVFFVAVALLWKR